MKHALRKISVVTSALIALSCIKQLKEEPPALGPEVSFEKVEMEFSKAVYMNPREIKIGQETVLEANRRIENQDPARPVGTTKLRVIDQFENDSALCFVISVTTQEAGKEPVGPTESFLTFWKIPPNDSKPCASRGLVELKVPVVLKAIHRIRSKGAVVRTTYHNLIVEAGTEPPPPAVQKRENCGGVENCLLPVTRLQFDQADWYSDGTYDVFRQSLLLSNKAPYLAAILDRCISGSVPVDGRHYYVRDCEFVTDFKF